jgi:hypothetical protein
MSIITPLRPDQPRAPLANEAAEQGVLGALLADNATLKELGFLRAEHFATAVHSRIFDAAVKLIQGGHPANPVTLKGQFDQDAALSALGGGKYLAELAVSVPLITNAPDYAAVVHDLYLRRQFVAEVEDTIANIYRVDIGRPASAIVADHSARLARLAAEAANARSAGIDRGPIDVGEDNWPISPRSWLLALTFCRRFISGLLSQGAAGKTAVRIAQALALATGRALTGEHVFVRSRVLLVCLEDNLDELRRRVRAAMLHHGVTADDVRGWLFYWAPTGSKIAEHRDGSRVVVPGDLEQQVRTFIDAHKIDLVIFDPFVKTHTAEENDNTAIDAVACILARIAGDLDVAVDVLHHERKAGSPEAGDINRGRGASSFRDAARLFYTLTPMTETEREQFGLAEAERRSLVRVDSAKVNIAPRSIETRWFRIVGVWLGNETDLYPNGDTVPTVEPWHPPDLWRDISTATANAILDQIERGPAEGRRYSVGNRAEARAAWRVVKKDCPTLTDEQAQIVIATWLRNEILESRDYDDPVARKPRKGLYVTRRPG